MSPARRLALAAAAAYAALAGLVATGTLTGIDQWAVDHVMPGQTSVGERPTVLESVVPLLHADFSNAIGTAGQIVTLPGQVLVSLAIVAASARALRRRGQLAAAITWPGAWLAGTAIEVVCKHVLTRPALFFDGVHFASSDSSWPSGHTIRCAIVAAALATVWPRLRPLAALWLAAALALLVLAGFHTPSDVAGGLLLVVALAAAGHELGDSALLVGPGLRRGAGARGRARRA